MTYAEAMLAFHQRQSSYSGVNIHLNVEDNRAKEPKMCLLWPHKIRAWETLRGMASSACSHTTPITVNKG